MSGPDASASPSLAALGAAPPSPFLPEQGYIHTMAKRGRMMREFMDEDG